MPRRRVVAAREILPDPKFGSQTIAKFINHVMERGKKSIAESVVYGALERVAEKTKGDPVDFFESTLDKVRPMVEVKARRRAFPSQGDVRFVQTHIAEIVPRTNEDDLLFRIVFRNRVDRLLDRGVVRTGLKADDAKEL